MQYFIKIITIFLGLSIYSASAVAGDLNKVMQQKSFKVTVSNKNLANMHEASTLLISCVDFRLRDETERLMQDHLKLLDDYDEIALPGASLAMVAPQYPHWAQTTKEVIEILKSLHHIKRIIFLDHRGCGAYKLVLGAENVDTHEKETATHQKILAEAASEVKKQFPELEIYTLLIGLDGVVENMNPVEVKK